jgi:SAM-dependent methyltransferase
VYWLDKPEEVLKEIQRILKPGGSCCLMLPNRTFRDFSFYYNLYVKTKNKNFEFLEKLDRGRVAESIKQVKSSEEWLEIIAESGLEVVDHKRHLSKTVTQMWDIGLRPLFPVFYKMVSSIDKERVVDIKKEWIETLKIFLEPIARMDCELNPDDEPAFHCFILKK